MLILALESSAKAASAALCRDGVLIAQSQQCSGLTHSCTLLLMAEQMLKNTDTKLTDVDAIAVARGPGSFTGIRIGVSTAKGLAWGAQKPAIGVSTLEAMAYHGIAAVVWIRYGYPLVAKLMANLKKHILPWMTVVLTVFMAVNMGLSALALARYDARTSGLAPANQLDVFLDEHFDNARMERVYPNAKKTG